MVSSPTAHAHAESRDGVDGYRINGHWRWGSGCRNAGDLWWHHEVDEAGEPVQRAAPLTRVFFRPEEIDIQDNWHVSGLRGSGSSDYIAEDVWVPAERMAGDVEDSVHAQLPIYQFPKFATGYTDWCDLSGYGSSQHY